MGEENFPVRWNHGRNGRSHNLSDDNDRRCRYVGGCQTPGIRRRRRRL